ncbi:MAG TPA: RsmF rRNA methyltransferase first C-terminal domain-containing protein [Actinomycetota bacterium]|nr:RsmF rRNA methyltransferase first C-terminal domain-containing protein [Actinomycetota bacterium]
MTAGLPGAFEARMRQLLGPEAPAFLASYRRPAQRAVRANPLKLDPAALPGLLGIPPDPVPWSLEAWFLPEGVRVGDTLAHAAGLCYVQEPSALAVAEVLDVRPGQRVLDLAAAPGGKATQAAGRLGGRGVVVANEVQRGRAQALADNLDRWGSPRTVLAGETVARLAAALPGEFDRVLLDAPCSGEGLFRRNPAAAAQWRPGHVGGNAERQRGLLADAARLVRPGGVLVYSTCTFAPEENEQQVAGFLAANPAWELLPIPMHPGFAPGRPDWAPGGPPELARTVRLWPHHLRGEGHFIAKLTRPGSPADGDRDALPGSRERGSREGGSREVLEAWRGFAAEALEDAPPGVTAVGERVYSVPDPEVATAGVRLVRPGLLLGRVRPGRFEPAHALAMAVGAGTARRVRVVDGREAAAWVRGETVGWDGPAGWAVVTWNGWPLGWGRGAGGTLKNHYPKGLRTMRPAHG